MSKLSKEDFSGNNRDVIMKAFIEGVKYGRRYNCDNENYLPAATYYLRKQKNLKEIVAEIEEVSNIFYNLGSMKYVLKFKDKRESVEFFSYQNAIDYLLDNFPIRMEFDKSFK